MNKCPYAFTAKTRKAMIAYLLDGRRSYYDGHTFLFSWNVKVNCINMESPEGEYEIDPAFNADWAASLEGENKWVEQCAFEDAQRDYATDWTSYSGDDQGSWKFGFYGRSGGHLCLESWRGRKFVDSDDAREALAEMPFADLRTFYRGIVCADNEFTPKKATENVEYCVNWLRGHWEDEARAERDAETAEAVAAIEASRPDLYPDSHA